MLKSICYVSSIGIERSVLETESLFHYSKKNNDSLNIKGLLFKCDTCFFQILEGPIEVIDTLFNKIKRDNRHKNINLLINQTIKEFTFSNFSTGYSRIDDLDSIFGIQEYHTFVERENLPKKEDFFEIISKLFNVEI